MAAVVVVAQAAAEAPTMAQDLVVAAAVVGWAGWAGLEVLEVG